MLSQTQEVHFSKKLCHLPDHCLCRRSASVRRESLRRSSSAIQLLIVLTISRSLCRSVFSERSTGKVFDLLFLLRFRTLTPEFITSSRFYSMSLNQPERLCNISATPFVRIRRLSLWLVAQIWKGHASERNRASRARCDRIESSDLITPLLKRRGRFGSWMPR